MHVIIPLAGPDFVRPDGSIKALTPFRGEPLLRHVINSRPWASQVASYSFILYDCRETRQFASSCLSEWYENSSVAYISEFSRGAALSILPGMSTLKEFCHPLVVDLADIIYESNINIHQTLGSDSAIGGIALTFYSQNPQYSYLEADENGLVIRSAEKKVISDEASVGTYIFRDCATVLNAVAHAINNETSQTHNSLFYVCPLFNGVLAQKQKVLLERVSGVVDIKPSASSIV